MSNKEVASILDNIGTLLELQGENPFKCRAYHNAARIISALTNDLQELIAADQLRMVKGIGSGLAEKITELVETGKLQFYVDLKQSLPPGLIEMLRIPGLGPKKIKLLHDRLKISTVKELQRAAKQHKIGKLGGFGPKSEENILSGIEQLQKHADLHLYIGAKIAAAGIFASIRDQRFVIRCDLAGSLRRRREIIGDIDILASVKPGYEERLMDAFVSHPDVATILARGDTKSTVSLVSGIRCDLRAISDSEYPFALAYFTGSKEHNVAMRSLARRLGWTLNEYGFSMLDAREKRGKAKQAVPCRSEEDIFRSLKLQYIPPELRENMGEIEAAQKDLLPTLIDESDLKGTFHCHTSYSDGANTVREMAQAAQALGWHYLGIADHSKIAAYAGGLTEARVKQQFKEIDTLNKGLKDFRLFKGTEVDILADGSLDWSDDILGRFDYVVASIHSKFKMTEAEATKRIIAAIKNRYVTMLGHPTGRLLLQREGYPVNMVEVIKAAADYGKIIEINSHPTRLDLDWRLVKFAKEQGVKISINPDAHTTVGLQDVQYGIGIARKGWLEKDDVINTYPLTRVTDFLYH